MSRLFTVFLLVSSLILAAPAASAAPPDNDDFANARAVVALPYEDTVNTEEATLEAGEPAPMCGSATDKSVWYSHTPDHDGVVRADTIGSNYDTVLAVYVWTDQFGLSAIACNDDAQDLQSRVDFQAMSGQQYVLQVSGYAGASGTLTFSVAAPLPVANDDFEDATGIEDLPFEDEASTVNATMQDAEPAPTCGYDVGASVWYTFTPDENGSFAVDTFGSDFDTVVAVYTGTALDSLDEVRCNDDAESYQSQVLIDGTAGIPYHIQVAGYGGETGNLQIHVGEPRCPSGYEKDGLLSGTLDGTVRPLAKPLDAELNYVSCLAAAYGL